MIIQMIYLVN